MEKLSKNEMKNVMGGEHCPWWITCCPAPDSVGCYNGTCIDNCGGVMTCTCQGPIQ